MLGIIPAAGAARRLQPLPFSKELLPVASRTIDGGERPRAVSEMLIERLLIAGATRLCFVVAPRKLDIISYYGGGIGDVPICYAIQPEPTGLCDAVFRGLPFASPDELVTVGLPDTVWFPTDALLALPRDTLSLLLFPVEKPEFFDAVVTDELGRVLEVQVKSPAASSNWIWGAFQGPCATFRELCALWVQRCRRDEYIGTPLNEYVARGGRVHGVRAGTSYIDVGTVTGYRRAFADLQQRAGSGAAIESPKAP